MKRGHQVTYGRALKALLVASQRRVMRERLLALAFTKDLHGDVLYHGGKKKIVKVDLSRVQSRDSGFYGDGFYVTTAPHYAKSYGRVLSTFVLNSKAKVVGPVGLNKRTMDKKLWQDVRDYWVKHYLPRAKARGKEEGFWGEIEYWDPKSSLFSPTEWSRTAYEYGKAVVLDDQGFEVSRYEGPNVGGSIRGQGLDRAHIRQHGKNKVGTSIVFSPGDRKAWQAARKQAGDASIKAKLKAL